MTESTHALGDVQFFVVRVDTDRLSPTVLEALLRQVEAGAVRLLDVLLIRRPELHAFALSEVNADEFDLAGLTLHSPGLVSEDDVRHFTSALPVGAFAMLILVEPTWAEQFSADVLFHGSAVLAVQPIPATVANAAVAFALARTGDSQTEVCTASRRDETPSLR